MRCGMILTPSQPSSADFKNCQCMPPDVRALLEHHAALGPPPSALPEMFRCQIPTPCVCMSPEVLAFIEACTEMYNVRSENGHSPASMDLSDNLTPSSSGHPGGSTASYSPLGFGGPGRFEIPKDGWEMLDFGSGAPMEGDGLGEYFLESTR